MWLMILLTLVGNGYSFEISDKEYAKMPTLFEMDDYDHCMLHGDEAFYCEMQFNLEPDDPANTSEVWNIIERLTHEGKFYRHDWLRHGVCITTTCPGIPKDLYKVGDGDQKLKDEINACYSRKYAHLGLKGKVFRMHCETKEPVYPITAVDLSVAGIIIVFLAWIVLCTFYEGLARYEAPEVYEQKTKSPVGKVLVCFSLIKNYERLVADNINKDAVKMKSIQGVRFYNMITIIMAHVCMGTLFFPISNPTFNEYKTDDPMNMFIANGGYVVQTFFGISGWLVAFHFFESSENKKEVKCGYLILAFINRYIRLLPALLVVYAFNATWLVHMGRGPFWDRTVGGEYRNCRNNGWSNILFINNYYNSEYMCLQQTWYMAVDTQVFIVAIVITWMMKNYEKYAMKIVCAAIFVATCIPMAVNYYYDFDIIIRQYPEPLYEILLKVPEWHIMFTSGYNNMAGYLVGVMFGYIFYKNREYNCFTSKVYQVLWWMTIWFLPLFVILVAGVMYQEDFHYTRFGAAFYIGVSRTMFPIGIILAIWGISQKQGWFMRYFTEWNAVQVFGRLTYCAYLIHVTLLKIRLGKVRSPIYVTEYLLVFDTFGDVSLAYTLATVLCLAVEMPASALQKLMLPHRKKTEDKQLNGSGKKKGESNSKLLDKEDTK